MIVQKLTLSLTTGTTNVPAAPYVETGNSVIAIADVVAANSTNLLRTIGFAAASVQAVWLLASTDLTIKTNSSGSPANTINLKGGIPYVWSVSPGYFTAPFTADVTAWYQTNSTVPTTLTGYILTS